MKKKKLKKTELMRQRRQWFLVVEADEYELPVAPPFDNKQEICKVFDINYHAVDKAIKRGSDTKIGRIIKINAA